MNLGQQPGLRPEPRQDVRRTKARPEPRQDAQYAHAAAGRGVVEGVRGKLPPVDVGRRHGT